MTKILITGAGSYIGESFKRFIEENFDDQYSVDTIDMIDGGWRKKSFSLYDTVFHVAGIAHQKETKENAHLYYEVNRDLAVETCKKAKSDGVQQFIFLSSMSVYGMDTGVITKETLPHPKTNYGKSKLMAEQEMQSLADASFKVCILRPPMVYGNGCRGNYQTVIRIVEKSPIFPRISNRRSMISIENLTAFVKMVADLQLSGVYFPQDKDYVCTMDMASNIAQAKGKRLYFSYLCGFGVMLFRPFVRKLQKAFGSLIYSDTEDFDFSYCTSIKEDIE